MSKLSISLSLTNPPRRIPIEIESDAISKSLFAVASKATSIPIGGMKLIFRGRIISNKGEGDDVSVAEEFMLESGSVIHCMGKPVLVENVNANADANAATTSASSSGAGVSSGSTVSVPPTASTTTSTSASNLDLSSALQTIKNSHPGADYKTALTTLSKLLQNVIQNPMEEKYRKVKNTNAAFQKRLGRLNGSQQAIYAIGFKTVGEEYVLAPSPEAWPSLLQADSTIGQALRDYDASTSSSSRNRSSNNNSGPSAGVDMGFGGVPTMPSMPNMPNMGTNGMPPAGSMPPGMLTDLLSNPTALQSMLQDPMVQQMMQNHPQLANNPQMQQQMRMLANNPQMMEQMSRMMSDPNMMERMTQMMQGGGMGNMGMGVGGDSMGNNSMGGGMDMNRQMELMRQFANANSANSNANANTNATPASNNVGAAPNNSASANQNTNNGASNNNGGGNDEMTEEEMIAAAIARSMREQ